MKRIVEEQYPRFESETNPTTSFPIDANLAHDWIHSTATQLGADIVGVARIEPHDVYHGKVVAHTHAIVLGKRMQYEEFVSVPSHAAAVECLRIYYDLGEVVINLAYALRAAGVCCVIEHPIGDSSVLHIPLALKAGFGELGRHGSIIHPEFGPLFRIGSILLSENIRTDQPTDAGIAAFCDSCKACRMLCPADAIPDERSNDFGTDPLGLPRYVVDTAKCFPYFATANYCSACLAVCAYKHKKWARGRDGNLAPFPTVNFGVVPPAVDNVPERAHKFPPLRRNQPSPYHRK
jgi:epoxyqueuosine reductase